MTSQNRSGYASPAPNPRPPSNYGPAVRGVVYTMLAVSAAVSVFFGDHLWSAWHEGLLPVWAPLMPPACFTAFVVVYTVDRWLLVRRRHYQLSRALFQVAFALVFLTLLLPQQAQELRQAKEHDHESTVREPAMQLLAYPDETVRAAACMVLVGHLPPDVLEQVQSLGRNDPSARVRSECNHAFERLHAAL